MIPIIIINFVLIILKNSFIFLRGIQWIIIASYCNFLKIEKKSTDGNFIASTVNSEDLHKKEEN